VDHRRNTTAKLLCAAELHREPAINRWQLAQFQKPELQDVIGAPELGRRGLPGVMMCVDQSGHDQVEFPKSERLRSQPADNVVEGSDVDDVLTSDADCYVFVKCGPLTGIGKQVPPTDDERCLSGQSAHT
jgi:hypothetical protein